MSQLDLLRLVNRDHPLSDDFHPDLEEIIAGSCLFADRRCLDALKKMLADCESAGFSPLLVSAQHGIKRQKILFAQMVERNIAAGMSKTDAETAAAKVVAVPGTSEHHTGLAFDIVDSGFEDMTSEQANQPAQKWLMSHCHEYGFILRYPEGSEAITGIVYEPWHYRYVGKPHAEAIMKSGITLETYLRGRVPHWLVRNPRFNQSEAWPEKDFPDARLRYMKHAGCLVCSLAILLRMYGIENETDEERFNPWILNERLKEIKAFTSGADLIIDSIHDLYDIEFVGREAYSHNRIKQLLSENVPCLIRVPGVQDAYHFVVPWYVCENDVRIIDSGWEKNYLSEFSGAYIIYRFRRTGSGDSDSGSDIRRETVIRKAVSYIGVQESTCDANDVFFNVDYYGYAAFSPEYKWCVSFLWDVFRLSDASPCFFDGQKTARCVELYQWAERSGRLVDKQNAVRGDIVLFDWHKVGRPVHAGLVLGWIDDRHLKTIEGNTSDVTEENAPGRVMVQTRGLDRVFAVIHLDYDINRS